MKIILSSESKKWLWSFHSLIKVLKLKADEKYPCRYEMPDY